MDRLVFFSVVGVSLRCVLDLVLLEDFKYIVVSEVQRFVHGRVIPPVLGERVDFACFQQKFNNFNMTLSGGYMEGCSGVIVSLLHVHG